jgi:hypothetical protein
MKLSWAAVALAAFRNSSSRRPDPGPDVLTRQDFLGTSSGSSPRQTILRTLVRARAHRRAPARPPGRPVHPDEFRQGRRISQPRGHLLPPRSERKGGPMFALFRNGGGRSSSSSWGSSSSSRGPVRDARKADLQERPSTPSSALLPARSSSGLGLRRISPGCLPISSPGPSAGRRSGWRNSAPSERLSLSAVFLVAWAALPVGPWPLAVFCFPVRFRRSDFPGGPRLSLFFLTVAFSLLHERHQHPVRALVLGPCSRGRLGLDHPDRGFMAWLAPARAFRTPS